MVSKPDRSDAGLDWVARATALDLDYFHLNITSPLEVNLVRYTEPHPLDFDLHRPFEFGIVLSGQMVRHYEGLVVTLETGDVWICAAWEPHGWEIPRCGEVINIVSLAEIFYEPPFERPYCLDLFSAPPTDRHRINTSEGREEILAIGCRLKWEIEKNPSQWQDAIRANISTLLLILFRRWEELPAINVQSRIHVADFSQIIPALNIFHPDPAKPTSLREAAAACNLSVPRFTEIFRATMGISFNQFKLRNRLSFAAHHLMTTNLTLDTIATKAGFTDASHLNRAFLRQYGCTPGKYRDQRRGFGNRPPNMAGKSKQTVKQLDSSRSLP